MTSRKYRKMSIHEKINYRNGLKQDKQFNDYAIDFALYLVKIFINSQKKKNVYQLIE